MTLVMLADALFRALFFFRGRLHYGPCTILMSQGRDYRIRLTDGFASGFIAEHLLADRAGPVLRMARCLAGCRRSSRPGHRMPLGRNNCGLLTDLGGSFRIAEQLSAL